ncbi:MAG TPA: primase-helicase zinc-binding domain-containing protein, partial [Solidesulfovibrio magneticus]|nr:primase-helicase zinc-binding domain-containing protein [Solidesulfovibrio magneticus]
MAADLLGLFEAHGLMPKKESGTSWGAPCPACGGKDRCVIKPADHDGRGGYFCRRCNVYGDAIQFLRDYEGMSYAEACKRLGVAVARSVPSLPRVPRQPAGQEPFEAVPQESPAELWQTKATKFSVLAHQHLLAHPRWLAWLASRGLPLEAAQRYRLGYNPGEKGKTCLIRPRSSWGLPPLEPKPAKDGEAPAKPKTTFWIPRGVVIPQLSADPDGPVRRLRIRRPDEDRRKFKEETKYYVIPGSSMDAMILGPQSQAFVVVESELDALMLHHHVGDLVGVVSIQTANVRKIAADVHAALSQALCILVALDAEGAGGAGAKGWARWAASFPRAKRWPCPVGKDPGEAFEKGANLRAWVMAGLPPALLSGRLRPGRSAQGEGENREQGAAAAVGAAEAAAVSTETPDLSPETAADGQVGAAASTATVPEALPPVRWLTPDYGDAADVVPIRELVAAIAAARVEPVLLA